MERRRAPAGSGHLSRTVDPSRVDQFGGSMRDLRAHTEHSAACTACGGTGLSRCPTCSGSGRVRCGACGGAGRTYLRSKRGAACKPCHETGKLPCHQCDGTTKVTCAGCDGGGAQIVWFEYAESRRTVVAFDQDSPTLVAHGHLREARFLRPGDLERFTPFVTVQEDGPLDAAGLEREDSDTLWRIAPKVDARLERVAAQQLLKFGVLRRDVRYEMCGAVGTLALSGANLVGASTPGALKPIRRRLLIVGASAVFAFAVLGEQLAPGVQRADRILRPHERAGRCPRGRESWSPRCSPRRACSAAGAPRSSGGARVAASRLPSRSWLRASSARRSWRTSAGRPSPRRMRPWRPAILTGQGSSSRRCWRRVHRRRRTTSRTSWGSRRPIASWATRASTSWTRWRRAGVRIRARRASVRFGRASRPSPLRWRRAARTRRSAASIAGARL